MTPPDQDVSLASDDAKRDQLVDWIKVKGIHSRGIVELSSFLNKDEF